MEKRLGNIFGYTGGNYAGNVYDQNYIAPTLNTMQGGYKQPMIIEANSIRMVRTEESKRLRKMYENHELHHGFNEHREMELRTDGVSNTLTSVQKDNLVFERKICAVDEQNMNLRYETFGTLTTDGSSPKHNNRVMETVRIKQATKDGYIECKIGGVADLSFPSSTTRRGRVQESGDVCPTLTASESEICRIERCRIRKLTPLECWRLMDFSDEDFHKAESVNSNTQLYKQAGNSIVRNVLVAIIGQMLQGKEDVYKGVITND